ncbi:hypothetical protein HHI36_009643 [Cryptolaemus montrouzieri]|uniref:Uncharacterized protein n=1 Tax=Cryptolaemus montrouzieri TaxID=559131 RepID=A0ABD2MGG2_9CUCU
MKVITGFLIFFLSLYHVSPARLSLAHKNPPHPDCVEHSKFITQDQVNQLNKGGYPDSPVIRQHLLCIWKEKGAMNEEGILQTDVIKSKIVIGLGDVDDRKAAEKCIVQKENAAETAYEFYKCISPFLAKYNN